MISNAETINTKKKPRSNPSPKQSGLRRGFIFLFFNNRFSVPVTSGDGSSEPVIFAYGSTGPSDPDNS